MNKNQIKHAQILTLIVIFLICEKSFKNHQIHNKLYGKLLDEYHLIDLSSHVKSKLIYYDMRRAFSAVIF